MFTEEEYRKKIDELRQVAHNMLAIKTPGEALEMVSKMNPVDAYILGRIIGSELQADSDMKAFMRAISSAEQMMEIITKGRKVAGAGNIHN